MLKNETEYRRAVEEVTEQRGRLEQQIERLRGESLSDEQVRLAMEPLWAYHRQLAGEIERYERIKRGEFDVLRNLERLGELLIAVRIYLGLTQAELAEHLGVDPSVVCRDERNEYHGVTLERAAKILNAMRVELRTSVEVPGHGLATLPRETPAVTTRQPRIGTSQRWQAVAADSVQFLDHSTESPVTARPPKDQPGSLKSTAFHQFPQSRLPTLLSYVEVASENPS